MGGPPERDRLALAVILAVAFCLRLAYLLAYHASDWWDALIMDPGNHWAIAGRIAHGEGMGPYAFFRAPLYLYLLAFFRAALGDSLWPIRLLQLGLGVAACGMVFSLARRLMRLPAAFLAALVYALWWVPVYFDGELLTDSPATFLNLLVILLLVRADEAGPRRLPWLAAAGFAAGLSAITRPNLLPFAAAVAAVIFWRAFRASGPGQGRGWQRALAAAAVFAAGVTLPILPVTVRNLVVGHDFVLIASQGGINFWAGNNAEADGRTVVVPAPRRVIPLSYLQSRSDNPWLREDVWLTSAYGADTALKRRSTESEISDYWYGQARAWMAAHPGAALGHTARKALYLFSAREVSNNRDLDYHRGQFAALRFSPVATAWVMPLALAGIVLALAGPDRRRFLWLILFVLFYGASVVMFFVTTRYRVPLLPVLAVFLGYFVDRVGEWVGARDWRKAGAAVLLAVVLAVPVNLDRPAWNDRPLRSAMRYNLGIALLEKGRTAASERELRAAVAIKDFYPEAWFWLGMALTREDRWAEAARALEKSVAQGPGYAPARVELDRVRARLGAGVAPPGGLPAR